MVSKQWIDLNHFEACVVTGHDNSRMVGSKEGLCVEGGEDDTIDENVGGGEEEEDRVFGRFSDSAWL